MPNPEIPPGRPSTRRDKRRNNPLELCVCFHALGHPVDADAHTPLQRETPTKSGHATPTHQQFLPSSHKYVFYVHKTMKADLMLLAAGSAPFPSSRLKTQMLKMAPISSPNPSNCTPYLYLYLPCLSSVYSKRRRTAKAVVFDANATSSADESHSKCVLDVYLSWVMHLVNIHILT
jgi:hypothetical protein